MKPNNENQQDHSTLGVASEPVKRRKVADNKPQSRKKKAFQSSAKTMLARQVQSLDLLAIATRRKALIFAACFFGLLVGAAYYLFLIPKYESRAELMLLQNESAAMASHVGSGKDNISQDLLATHMSLVQSHRIIQQALASHQLLSLPSLEEKITDKRTIVDYVSENLYVTRGGKGAARNAHTLSIAFRHTSQEDCTKVVRAIVTEYQDFVSSKFKDINEEAVKLINTARLELDDELEQQSSQYKEFRNSVPLISTNNRNIHEQRYQDLSAEISRVQIGLDEFKSRQKLVLEGLEQLNDDSHPLEKLSLIDERNATRLGILVSVERGEAQTAAFQALQPQRAAGATTEFSKLLELKSRLKNVRIAYGPKHPQVQELETQIHEIESFLNQRKSELGLSEEEQSLKPDDVMNAYVRLLQNDILALEQRLLDLQRQQQEAETEAKKLVLFELENEDMVRRRSRLESLYDSVVSRLKDINMRQDSTGMIQEEIQPPTLGERVAPSGVIAAIITLLSSAFLAGSTVLVAELMDKRIRSIEELEELFGAAVIGQVIDFRRHDQTAKLLRKLKKGSSAVVPELIAFHDAKNPISEVFRTLRTQALFNLGRRRQVLVVSSPLQGDGKSTVTANLAISLASTDKRVLLIDCDLRRPTVHQMFGLGNDHGLADCCSRSNRLEDCVQATPIENLLVLTSGGMPDNPAELLSSMHFLDLLSEARQQFDMIILDCPPLLPVADPSIVAPLADGLLLVTSTDSESLLKARECHRILSRIDVDLVGIVVNKSIFQTPGYYKKYQGYYAESTPR